MERLNDMVALWWLRTLIRARDERGDVPGWVMVTVMSAAVVAVLLPLARTQLSTMLDNAMAMVTGSAG